jgi:hypothetical protein
VAGGPALGDVLGRGSRSLGSLMHGFG